MLLLVKSRQGRQCAERQCSKRQQAGMQGVKDEGGVSAVDCRGRQAVSAPQALGMLRHRQAGTQEGKGAVSTVWR